MAAGSFSISLDAAQWSLERMADPPAELPPITRSYLICLNIPSYRDTQGVHYLDPLWHKDLIQHVRYLKNLTLALPCRVGELPQDALAWGPPLPEIRFVDLPSSDGVLAAIFHLPSIALRLWTLIGQAEVVHFGVAGWPIPLGWLASPLAALRNKASVVVVESAPWRLRPGMPDTLTKRLKASLYETLGRWCVNHSSIVIVTQEEYGRTLLTDCTKESHVIHASWLDAKTVISQAKASESWRSKRFSSKAPLKLLFAGRLERSKGLPLLLEAMRILSHEGVPVELDILGEGELESECRYATQESERPGKNIDAGHRSLRFHILRNPARPSCRSGPEPLR